MDALRTLILALVCALPLKATAAEPLHMVFAGCLGRYSAEVEHHWLQNEDATEAADHRLTFQSLYEATVPRDAARDALHHRIAAKMAQAALLTTASFHHDPDRASTARSIATAQISSCRRMLLES
ncbi:MAG: hypothetical protein AAFR53_08325 [Pseudomonadota bacterium]